MAAEDVGMPGIRMVVLPASEWYRSRIDAKMSGDLAEKYFNQVIELRSEYLIKIIDHTSTSFDFTLFLKSFIALISHTVYYIPSDKKYKNKPLSDEAKNLIQRNISNPILNSKDYNEILELSNFYTTTLQEESICSYK